MNRFVTAACVTLLLVGTCNAQESEMQPRNATMSVQEFRPALVDLGSYIDSHKNSNLAAKFSASSDHSLETILPAVQDRTDNNQAHSAGHGCDQS